MQIIMLDGKEMMNEIKTHQILKEKLGLPDKIKEVINNLVERDISNMLR